MHQPSGHQQAHVAVADAHQSWRQQVDSPKCANLPRLISQLLPVQGKQIAQDSQHGSGPTPKGCVECTASLRPTLKPSSTVVLAVRWRLRLITWDLKGPMGVAVSSV